MIVSMTGHGRAVLSLPGKTLTAELRSVNSRYLDITCKIPRQYIRFEDRIKKEIGRYATRGKIDLFLTLENTEDGSDDELSLNRAYLKNYLECLAVLRDEYGLRDDITVSSVAANRDIFMQSVPEEESDEVIWSRLLPPLTEALLQFSSMKKTEGAKMKADLLEKLAGLESIIEQIKALMPTVVNTYRERLTAKMREILTDMTPEDVNYSENRILTEVALYSDKVAVDEETVRLASHFEQFRAILSSDNPDENDPVGRKLDFLLQEINREINTTGSKVTDASVAALVVEAKSEAEKIREQVQNIE